jgi:hypothetical protein
MKVISRRLGRLEGFCGFGPETRESRLARERVETLLRRIADRRVREGLPPLESVPARQDLTGLSRSEILRLRYKGTGHATGK